MKKTKMYMPFAMILLSFTIAISIRSVSAVGEPTISIVDPSTGSSEFHFPSDTAINSTFIVNVTAANFTYLAAYQLNITWDPTLLEIRDKALNADMYVPSDNIFGAYPDLISNDITDSAAYMAVGILFSGPEYVNVTYGTLCQIRFTIIKNGTEPPNSCNIHFVLEGEDPLHTKLVDPDSDPILYTAEDGSYFIPEFHMNILLALFPIMTLCAFVFGRKKLISRRLHT